MSSKENKFYVYALLDPRKPSTPGKEYKYGQYEFEYEPFYIGKGTGYRCKEHITEAFTKTGKSYNIYKCRKIRKIKEETGRYPIINKIKTNLTDDISIQLEIGLIKQIGRKDRKLGPLLNMTDGGDGASGHILTEETKRKIIKSNKKTLLSEKCRIKKQSISIGGVVYPTIKDASKILNIPRTTIQRRLVSENFKIYLYVGEQKYKGLKTLINHTEESKQKMSIVKTGVKMPEDFKDRVGTPIFINGVRFRSIREGSRQLNIDASTLSRRLKNGKPGYEYANKNGQ